MQIKNHFNPIDIFFLCDFNAAKIKNYFYSFFDYTYIYI